MVNFSEWFSNNWGIIISILLSIMAILFTALRDFILPYFFKPKLKISYLPIPPYKMHSIVLTGSILSAFDRFKIENLGKSTAKNCRCQIYSIKNKEKKELDLQGFPLKWANWPDMLSGFEKKEKINIGPGESEFVDFVYMRGDDTTKIFLSSYDGSIHGKGDNLYIDNYNIEVIISGDNFKPYIAIFKIGKQAKMDGFKVKLLNIRRK